MSKLIECKMCRNKISPNANFYPRCGEPMNIEKTSVYPFEIEKHYEPVKYDVYIYGYDGDKVKVIDELRSIMELGYSYSRKVLENSPQKIKENIDELEVKEIFLRMCSILATVKVYETGTEKEKTEDIKQKLGGLLSFEMEKEIVREIERNVENDILRCPNCRETNLMPLKKGFGLGKVAGGALIQGPVRLLGRVIGSNNMKCLDCGHVFAPKNYNYVQQKLSVK